MNLGILCLLRGAQGLGSVLRCMAMHEWGQMHGRRGAACDCVAALDANACS